MDSSISELDTSIVQASGGTFKIFRKFKSLSFFKYCKTFNSCHAE